MKDYNYKNLRNVGLIGHGATGKTSLAEALLFYTNNTDRLGKVEDGTTVMDYEQEEKKRGISLSTSIASFEENNTKINIVDMPGYFDFQGEMVQGMRAVDIATIVVCAVSGVQVGTEKAWDYCEKIKLPRAFFINKMDRENASFDKTLEQMKERFGMSIVPIQYPIGKESDFNGIVNVISKTALQYNPKTSKMEPIDIPEELKDKIDECKQMIMEAVAETDEELLDKYLNDGELCDDDIYAGLIKGCSQGEIAPVLCGSATKVIGIKSMINSIVQCFPSPEHSLPQKAMNLAINEEVFIKINEDKPFSALVFKTIADPFVGKISLFRVMTGKIKGELTVLNSNKEKSEKLNHLFFMRGKNQIPTQEIVAGDIGAVSKLQYTATGDTLCSEDFKIMYDKINLPNAVMPMAILPKAKGDEEKISLSLSKLMEEDPVFKVERDVENAETIIWGLGETHLEVIASRIKSKFGADVLLQSPKVPYRETIKGTSDVQGKHKKQSGGHGQYGDVKIKFEPRNDGELDLEFVDKVVGGAVPRNFIPAVEKGLRDCISNGVLAGYPVVGLKATLYDGSYHPVDSSEMAFKIAASIAYKKGLELAKPILLEPVMNVQILVPDSYMGDVMGDINKRRGRVIGMEPEGKVQKISAEVPMAEMFNYATDLRSMTQARGSFTSEFLRYDEVPANEVSKILDETRRLREEA
ncbi:elongation factor G [Clostridium celatum]|nr:elongation factor G [Clostridium celatum]MCE9656802.1 elongation factor G [Clostridium celatum]MDU2266858.1 elongation factor G [Clostridium celatum]MDU6297382.1 elongation factor G [Clostridium celatum]